MRAQVIQGFFGGGRPNVLQAVAQRQAAPHVPQARSAAVQRSANGLALQLPPHLSNFGSFGGQPLPAVVQRKMEAFFKTSFADVRVHVGPQAPSIGALAFTQGSNLYFAPGQYNPSTQRGQHLLGHELTHVVQQRSGRVPNPFGSGVAVVQDPLLEAEAERMGLRAALPQPPVQAKLALPVVQRAVPFALPPRPSAPPVIQRSSTAKGGGGGGGGGDEAEHNWDKVLCGYSSAGGEVDDAFRKAGYSSPRAVILRAIRATGWAKSRIAHSKGNAQSGRRGGTDDDIQKCKRALLAWLDMNPASGGSSSGRTYKSRKSRQQIVEDLGYDPELVRIAQLAKWAREGDKDSLASLKKLAAEGNAAAAEKLQKISGGSEGSTSTVSTSSSLSNSPSSSSNAPVLSVHLVNPRAIVMNGEELLFAHLAGYRQPSDLADWRNSNQFLWYQDDYITYRGRILGDVKARLIARIKSGEE